MRFFWGYFRFHNPWILVNAAIAKKLFVCFMKTRKFAIVDIETTGGRASRDKVTEIGIVLHDGEKIIGTYSTLINPECYIPYGITQLTGITQEMVTDAPRFYEVAKDIVEWTEGAIFVAHNARFDYGFLREEFGRLGYTFSRKQLCTVRLSRKVFPGLPSYSLENLIKYFRIKTERRHRALDDALATAKLLELALASEKSQSAINEMVNMGIQETRLPGQVKLEQLHDLPESCGVYYFHNAKGDVVYVGKSINIRKRIAEHFADQAEKGRKLQRDVADISYEVTGSELVALLLESYEIKRLRPSINKAQRDLSFPFGIHAFLDERGVLNFDVIRQAEDSRQRFDVISEYPTLSRAKARLNTVVRQYELCARFCHLYPGQGACFSFHLKQCRGVCAGQEPPEQYNQRAEEARVQLQTVFDRDFLLLDTGRQAGELVVVLVQNGHYAGYGYVDEHQAQQKEDLLLAIKTFRGNAETNRIIQRFMSQYPAARVIHL